jgi:hypothetical protein
MRQPPIRSCPECIIGLKYAPNPSPAPGGAAPGAPKTGFRALELRDTERGLS